MTKKQKVEHITKNILDGMLVGQRIVDEYSNWEITAVPTGWIYVRSHFDKGDIAVFVPSSLSVLG